jgi:hypothetical protein
MNKKGKTKLFAILGICIIALLVTAVFIRADSAQLSDNETGTAEEKTDNSFSEDVSSYVKEFVQEKGVNTEDINNISKVDFDSLPKEVNIENVNDANLAIYQIDYNKSDSVQDKLFVVTYAVEKLASQGDLIVSQDKREFLNFGFNGQVDSSGFLRSATGVEGSLEKGYVMMRSGSITGISTSLEFLSKGNAEIIIYKNGNPIQFGNTFVSDSAGTERDYDTQSKGTVSFEAGDIISAYIQTDGIQLKDITTLVEITTN